MKKFAMGKKQIVLAVMVLLLGAAVYLNYYVASTPPTTTDTQASTTTTGTSALGESQFVNNTTAAPTQADSFSRARAEREDAREKALEILQDTLQDAGLSEAQKNEALVSAAAVAKGVEQESTVENLVKAKGFEECVAYVAQEYCHVIVKAPSLTEAQTLQIAQIVIAQTDVPSTNINIMAVEE